jgi:hypothetical protein
MFYVGGFGQVAPQHMPQSLLVTCVTSASGSHFTMALIAGVPAAQVDIFSLDVVVFEMWHSQDIAAARLSNLLCARPCTCSSPS